MNNNKQKPISKKKLTGLAIGLVLLVVIIRISNGWDTTRDIDYLKQPTITEQEATITETNRTVFICDNPQSHLYHFYRDCEELHQCNNKVVETKLSAAEDMDRKPCDKCAE